MVILHLLAHLRFPLCRTLEVEQDGQVKDKKSRTTVWKSNYYFAIFTTLLPYLSVQKAEKSFKLNTDSGTTCTLMVEEVPFLNGNLSIYSCFIDVLYDLRRILALAFALMSSAAFKWVKCSTIQLVLRELFLRIKLWVFE